METVVDPTVLVRVRLQGRPDKDLTPATSIDYEFGVYGIADVRGELKHGGD